MARLFDDATTEYLEVASSAVSGYPLTLAGWFYSDDAAAEQVIVSVADSATSANYHVLVAHGGLGGDPVTARSRAANGTAQSSTGYSINTWHHACGVFTAADDRAAFIDGGSKGTDATSSADTGFDAMSIGRVGDSSPSDYFSGRIAEVGIWDVALSDAEVAVLGAGYSPLFVRPQNLVAYWSLIRDEDQDRVGGFDMTAFNTPTIATHAPVSYPTPVLFIASADVGFSLSVNEAITVAESVGLSVVDPGSGVPMRHYRNRRA